MGALAEKMSGGDGGGGGDVDDEDLVDPSLEHIQDHSKKESGAGGGGGEGGKRSKRGRGLSRHKAHTIFRVTLLGPPESGKTALATQVRRGRRCVCAVPCGFV
jgi:hypothetical protein